jgi:methyl coenzyme M reductase subunit C-like uncharacterized protein (methanogenesis marker protein 7)
MDKDPKPITVQLGGLKAHVQNDHFEDLVAADTLHFESN